MMMASTVVVQVWVDQVKGSQFIIGWVWSGFEKETASAGCGGLPGTA